MQVKLVRRYFNLIFVFKYDRNTVINILKKQGVPAPLVIIDLLYHSSHILRTRESLIIFNLRVSCYNLTQNSFRTTEVFS